MSWHPCHRSLGIRVYNYAKVSKQRSQVDETKEDCAAMNGLSPMLRKGRKGQVSVQECCGFQQFSE